MPSPSALTPEVRNRLMDLLGQFSDIAETSLEDDAAVHTKWKTTRETICAYVASLLSAAQRDSKRLDWLDIKRPDVFQMDGWRVTGETSNSWYESIREAIDAARQEGR